MGESSVGASVSPMLAHGRVTAPSIKNEPGGPGQAAVDIWSSSKFISFRSNQREEQGIELGAVVRGVDGGVKLQSSQGDFAEFYRRAPGEEPFEEGDVVGFRKGMLTRRTDRCAMVGVVSRMAVVEGSRPPAEKRHLYDTVAHCGVVPVKLSLKGKLTKIGAQCDCPAPHVGQFLTPSGLHDGTAVLAPATNRHLPRLGVLLNDNLPQTPEPGLDNGGFRLVSAAVLAPPETTRDTARRSAQARRLVSALLSLMVVFGAVILLGRQLFLVPTVLDTSYGTSDSTKDDIARSRLQWGPPTLKNLTATCPDEVAACGLLGDPLNECKQLSEIALHQTNVGCLNFVPEELAVIFCYFTHYPPQVNAWPPLLPDNMILRCGRFLQKCQDVDICRTSLDTALDTSQPATLASLAAKAPDLKPLIGCTICTSSVDWAHHPQWLLNHEG